ncbi:helix-turn-helix domain-containing protein [Kineococcus sp. DHX-1]|uniref:AraC family transcriptional regulator n=1 Tax=Kineococcus sp. DHX-1 TaxID=3349638 RepID=UPI0036D27B49
MDETVEPVDEYVTRAPARALRPWVGAYSGYRQRGVPPVRHLGLPSPWLTVLITLDDTLHVLSHPDPRQPGGRYDALVGGLHVRPAVVAHGGRQSGVQVALHPLAARAVLGAPAGELASLDLPADAVLGPVVDRLRDRLSTLDWGARFDLLDRWFADRLTTPAAALPAGLGTACRRLVGGDGVATVARATGWSARHLTTLVRRETGLSPSALGRVARFDRARRLLQHDPGLRVSDVAALAGHCDASHLVRDFHDFAGLPPTTWRAQEFRSVHDTDPLLAAGSGDDDELRGPRPHHARPHRVAGLPRP